MRNVIFLDRDGVINNNSLYYVYKPEDVVFNDGVFETLKMLRQNGFEFIVISNQSGISKGIYSKIDVENVHKYMNNEFEKHGINILEFYYCTHHPEIENCLCRKPQTLLVEKAIARFNIDKSKSYLVGDKQTDADTAVNNELTPILIEPNSNLTTIISKISNFKLQIPNCKS